MLDIENVTLSRLLERHAQAQPSAPALLAPGHPAISYARLAAALSRTQPWLASQGLGPGSRIALLLPGGIELAVATLAIGCQATGIPLHPGLTEPELLALLADAHADALLGLPDDPAAARLARQLGLTRLALDLGHLLADPPAAPSVSPHRWPRPEPDDTAFVLFTSGTTGKPKRVPLTQRQILCSARNIAQHLALAAEDRGLCVMPGYHSHGLIGGLLTPLVAGSSVVCAPAFDASKFLQWIAEFSPTWYTAAPTIHHAVADLASRDGGASPRHRFRLIRSASSALSVELLQRIEDLWGAPVIESYGMTESATQMASNPMPPGLRKPDSVGRPAGAELRVIDEDGNTQPSGHVGSIVARGPALFTGYEDAPEANAEAFRDGWFVTGDLGHLDADGYLYITGRSKEFINRGGEKIAPWEVERALLRLPGVAQAAAYPAPHPTLGEDVHAVVVPAHGSAVEPLALRASLFGAIADFKIPASIHVLEKIPTGPGGKVQRRRLHSQISPLAAASPSTVPLTPLQASVATLFGQILSQAVNGAEANFLALGGDSLSAVRLVQAVNQTWGVDLSAPALLAMPTVGGFAAALQAAIDEADALSRAMQAEIDALSDEEVARLLGQA